MKSVLTMQHFVKAIFKCRKGVAWKGSVQKYWHHSIVNIYEAIRSIEQGKKPRLVSARRIILYERGKKRIIVPIVIDDRIIQRVICDECMIPVQKRSLIYDNGASMKDKGVKFARDRVMKHQTEAVKEYDRDFYVLTFDLKSFFDSIPHASCVKLLDRYFEDRQIKDQIMHIVQSYQVGEAKKLPIYEEQQQFLQDLRNNKKHGICLGSQISQVLALGVPNKMDHGIKDRQSIKHYIRYMDDGIVIAKTKEELRAQLQKIETIVEELGLQLNKKKTGITTARKGFIFLKIHYYVLPDGKIVRKIAKSGIVRMRRKLKKFVKKQETGRMTLQDIYASFQSWLSHSRQANIFHTVRSLKRLYRQLFVKTTGRCCV